VVRVVLQVRGTYSAAPAVSGGGHELLGQLRGDRGCFANAGIAPVSNTSIFLAAGDEFPKCAESLYT
jgi:hypothetical protein